MQLALSLPFTFFAKMGQNFRHGYLLSQNTMSFGLINLGAEQSGKDLGFFLASYSSYLTSFIQQAFPLIFCNKVLLSHRRLLFLHSI